MLAASGRTAERTGGGCGGKSWGSRKRAGKREKCEAVMGEGDVTKVCPAAASDEQSVAGHEQLLVQQVAHTAGRVPCDTVRMASARCNWNGSRSRCTIWTAMRTRDLDHVDAVAAKHQRTRAGLGLSSVGCGALPHV